MGTEKPLDLTGHLLVAMPGMADQRFDHAVILICAHSNEGAMGLIVNKPAPDLLLGALLDQLEITCTSSARDRSVYFGGPVEQTRGVVLHGPEYESRLQTTDLTDHFYMTATLDVLEEMAAGAGPVTALVLLGYAGWGPGQLEAEIARNDWLTTQSDPALVFGKKDEAKWGAAVRSLGIDPLVLSPMAGRA